MHLKVRVLQFLNMSWLYPLWVRLVMAYEILVGKVETNDVYALTRAARKLNSEIEEWADQYGDLRNILNRKKRDWEAERQALKDLNENLKFQLADEQKKYRAFLRENRPYYR